jgi:predicted glutamine amidotransferase
MCELMGLCFARPISADFSIREFARRGEENADGWGLAWYPDRSAAVVKEPIPWQASKYTGFLEEYHGLLSPVYIAHVRHKTVGGPLTHADTHPFLRELGGREYCFAHNGTVAGFRDQLPLGRFRPVGGTDSEHVFCHLLEEVARREGHLAGEDAWPWLHGKLAALNAMGKVSCLLSDGERLFCYHDAAGHKGLTFRKVRVRDHETRRFEDEEVRIDLEGESANHGVVVATQPLSKAGWHRFRTGELIVLEGGVVRFSSHRSPSSAEFGPG